MYIISNLCCQPKKSIEVIILVYAGRYRPRKYFDYNSRTLVNSCAFLSRVYNHVFFFAQNFCRVSFVVVVLNLNNDHDGGFR